MGRGGEAYKCRVCIRIFFSCIITTAIDYILVGFFMVSIIDFSKAMAVLSGSCVKPCLKGLSYMSFSFVKHVRK